MNAVSANYSDADFRSTMIGAIRLEAILCGVAIPFTAWLGGWQSALLLVIGAVISGSGLWEWLRLMTAVMVHMDAEASIAPVDSNAVSSRPEPNGSIVWRSGETPVFRSGSNTEHSLEEWPEPADPVAPSEAPRKPRGMGLVLVGFFLRLGVVLAVLYVSLKTLDGSVFAVAGGLGLGVFSLTVVALRKINA